MPISDYFSGITDRFAGVGDDIRELVGAKKLPGASAQPTNPKVGPRDIDPLESMEKEIKSSKLSGAHVDKIFDLVLKHNIMPGSTQFVKELGISMEQNGMAPTAAYGPFGPIRDMFSPKARDIIRQQEVAEKIGAVALEAALQMKQQAMQAPANMAEAQQAGLGNVIKPVASQMRGPGPYAEGLQIQPTVNPDAPLLPWQQTIAAQTLKSLAGGQQMQTPEGIVPTSYAGSRVSPEQGQAVMETLYGPGIQAPPVTLPTAAFDTVLREKGDTARQQIRIQQGPDVSNVVDEVSYNRFGKPFKQLTQPQMTQARTEAEEVLRGRVQFNQDQQLKRQLAAAGPVAAASETARKEADRDQPLAEPQQWRHPETAMAAPSNMTTRQAQSKGYVKVRPDQIETINQLEVIDKGLEEVKAISKRVLKPRADSPLGEALRAMGQTAYLSWLRAIGNADMVKLDSIVSRLTAPLVKSQGDTANIAVAEREMFARALVNNQASTEAVLANLDNVIETSKSARRMMGFKVDGKASPKEEVARYQKDTLRARIQALMAQGKTKEEIKSILQSEGFK